MPYVISCPTCQNGLTVHESPAAYVVACPTCRKPLTVPPAAVPVGSPVAFDAGEPEPPSRRRASGPVRLPWGKLLVLVFGVCFIVGIFVLAFRGSEKDAERADYQRALDLEYSFHADRKFLEENRRMIALGVRSTEGDRAARDAESRILEAAAQYNALIVKHPQWGKSPLRP